MVGGSERSDLTRTAIWNLEYKTMERRIDGGGHEDVIKHEMSRTLDTRHFGLSGTGGEWGGRLGLGLDLHSAILL